MNFKKQEKYDELLNEIAVLQVQVDRKEKEIQKSANIIQDL